MFRYLWRWSYNFLLLNLSSETPPQCLKCGSRYSMWVNCWTAWLWNEQDETEQPAGQALSGLGCSVQDDPDYLKKSYDQPRQHMKKQRHYFADKGLSSQSYGFPVVMYGCESWTIKKAECRRIDAFELWCWKRLLRAPWTARRSNQSILKEMSPEYSLDVLMLKLKLPYFGQLMRRADSFEKTLMLGKIEGGKRRGRQTEDEMVG